MSLYIRSGCEDVFWVYR